MSNTTNQLEPVINLKTTKALGLTVSRDLQLIQPATDDALLLIKGNAPLLIAPAHPAEANASDFRAAQIERKLDQDEVVKGFGRLASRGSAPRTASL